MKKYFKGRILSFRYAFSGLFLMLRQEQNARVHIVLAITAIVLGVGLKISLTEWCLLAIVTGMVFVSEAINSSIEKSVDLVTSDYNELAKRAKDLGACAVLISAFTALIVGIVIFTPKIVNLLLVII